VSQVGGMETAMKMQSVASKEISEYVSSHQKMDNTVVRVLIDGEPQVREVYRIPIKLLRFNIRNGRFASELRRKEIELKRPLDNKNAADSLLIRSLLLEQSSSETEQLQRDLVKHGQLEPGIITHDGAVINANRRMAVISKLHDDTHDPKWEFLNVAVLPDPVSEQDLWRIEADLQFGKDFRLVYGPINELLKLREGIECGLKPSDIEATLLGRFSEKQVTDRLDRLKLIDNYLKMIGRKDDYALIGEQHLMEKFISLSTNVIANLKAKTEMDPMELQRIAQTGFALIKDKGGRATHWDIRKLTAIARNSSAKKALLEALPEDPFEAEPEVLREAFSTAKDIVDSEKENDKPERLLQRALTAINSIDEESPRLASASAKSLLKELAAACKRLDHAP